ncbi:MAG: hypothetical protein LBF16_09760 [Pseudomonadales bacterium]|jgi:hypothetical protein|nr:hypothetical protein [Pseudomonadales bacterium]
MKKSSKILLSVVGGVILVLGGLYVYANQRIRAQVDAYLDALVANGDYDALVYERLEVSLSGSATMANLRVTKGDLDFLVQNMRLAVKRPLVTTFGPVSIPSWRLDFELQGLQFPAGITALLADVPPQVLAELAPNDTLPLTLHYHYDYAPDDRTGTEFNLDLSLPQAFSFTLRSTLRGIPPDLSSVSFPASNNPAQTSNEVYINALLSQGAIPSATLTLTDQGLLDTLLQHPPADSAMNPEQYRSFLIDNVNAFPLMLPPNMQSVAHTASAALAQFLGGNAILQVRIAPEFEGSFAQLQPRLMSAAFSGEADQVVALLHLDIETSAP